MRLVLPPKSMEGNEEKPLKSREQKSGKNTPKITKVKNIAAQYRR
jgi:hypothetical protein